MRIAIVGAPRFYSELLRSYLVAMSDATVVIEDASQRFWSSADQPDCIVVDCVSMELSLLLSWFSHDSPTASILLVGSIWPAGILRSCGARGDFRLVSVDDSLTSLREAIEMIASGEHVPTGGQRPRVSLSRREMTIARLAASGLSNKEIAARLQLEVSTVKNHMHRVLEKLSVRQRSEILPRLME